MPFLVALLFVASVPAEADGPGRSRSFRLTQQTATSWTYDYAPSPFLPHSVVVDGLPHRLFEGTETAENAGQPLLPTEVITLGVPNNVSATVELKDASYADEGGVHVAPSPTYERTEEGEAVPSYLKDLSAYSQDRFFPVELVTVEEPYMVRNARLVTIRISPIQYNPRSKILRRLSHATVVVHLREKASLNSTQTLKSTQTMQAAEDPQFEPEYRSLMANYDQARTWRYRAAAQVSQDSSGMWFTPGTSYVRLPVAQDGWYKITAAELGVLGVSPPALDTSTVKVLFRGKEIPLLVAPDMSLSFFGSQKRGDSTYQDYYTDTSAYWLSWQSPGQGKRYRPVPDLNIASADTLSASRTAVHFEENKDYYEGTGDAEVTLNGQAPGEGWVWEYFYPNTLANHDFTLDNVWKTRDTSVVLRVRLFSTTRNYNNPDHIARFWINDSLLSDIGFTGRTQGLYHVTFPSRFLKEGTNRLTIQSVPTASSPNQFYLDWFEVEYVRDHVAQSGQLVCSVSPESGRTNRRILGRGFPSAAIRAVDLTNGRVFHDLVVSAEGGGTFAATFDDTVTIARRYLMVSDTSALHITAPSRKTFSGLRQRATGADYIIITHSQFHAAANTLAAHRGSHNGVRTAVVDVQDIYDEFNYGHLSSESIKAFLRYAYENWPGPTVSHVLMFGDASWDYRRNMATTVMTNFVPAYGVPAGDNWYVCYDSTRPYLPSINIGRIPVQNAAQAARVVEKVIGYDSYALADWNKNFLFITGGITDIEKLTFNGQSDAMIRDVVLPAPIGGTPLRVYKTTPNTIDGENKQLLRALVRDGLVFMNFLGHSGGRIWGVDIGTPGDLENTSGMLPFITSVSCNVAAFAEPSSNVLSEDFVLAENRGAIAMWASSSLGYASVGATLVRNFLETVRDDTTRVLGQATTGSRIKLWQSRGSDYITVASLNLNPLLGDPLSSLAIPGKPDLSITPQDLSLDVLAPTLADSTVRVRMIAHNYGLVPPDSVEVSIVDEPSGAAGNVSQNFRVKPTLHRDTVLVPWKGTSVRGGHRLHVNLDPQNTIAEVSEANNTASFTTYVYAHTILGVRPIINEAVQPGPVELVASSPVSGDTSVTMYEFELDTTLAFTSGVRTASGPIQPGPVGARWTTPPLSAPGTWFWRARTVVDTTVGKWMVGRFAVESDAPARPLVSWREKTGAQFSAGRLEGTAVTDSGVTLRASPSLSVAARSLGYRANADKDYYSTIRVNEQTVTGLWWEHGNSFMVVRLNAFTGFFEFKPFNLSGNAVLADSMKAFIDATNAGDYLLISVIFDGYTNVSAGLRASIQALGSTRIDSVRPGHSWILIARKQAGPPYFVLEQWSPGGVAEDSTVIPNNFAVGSGTYVSAVNPFPSAFGKFRWTTHVSGGTHAMRASVLGLKPDGRADTLARIASTEAEADLAGLVSTFKDSTYTHLSISSLLSTTDALTTPLLRNWSIDVGPPSDLAISNRTVGKGTQVLAKTSGVDIPLTVHNIGYRAVDSARIRVDVLKPDGQRQPLLYATSSRIPVDSLRTVLLSIPADGLTGNNDLEIVVSPPAGERDLLAENNTARVNINFTSVSEPLAATVRVYADGVPLMDGDYVSSQPQVLVQLEELTGVRNGQERVNLYVDNQAVMSNSGGATGAAEQAGSGIQAMVDAGEFVFAPRLSDGPHEISVRLYRWNGLSGVDSIEHRVAVNVVSDCRILRVFNYPNPFSTSTEFTFVLTGARTPEELTIRIFTIAGRRIQEIRVPHVDLRIGFNRVQWDGRDFDGDEIANGYYLYQVQAKGEGKVESAIEKMAKVR